MQSEYGPWEWDGVRRAGVSSFGVGGTNAHVVLEEAPRGSGARRSPAGPQVLLLSARTAEGAGASRGPALAAALSGPDALGPVRRRLHARRPPQRDGPDLAAVVNDREHAARCCGPPSTTTCSSANPSTSAAIELGAGRFPVSGPGRSARRDGARPVRHPSRCSPSTSTGAPRGSATSWASTCAPRCSTAPATNLERTDRAQPALFAVEYALAQVIESYGVRAGGDGRPQHRRIRRGHPGRRLRPPTAIKAVSMRARLMHAAPPGVMVAVALGPDDIAEYLSPGVDLAAVNDRAAAWSPDPTKASARSPQRLAERGHTARRVRTSHAFHSSSMDAVLPEFEAVPVRPEAPRAAHTAAVQRHRNLDDRRTRRPIRPAGRARSAPRSGSPTNSMCCSRDPHRSWSRSGPGGSLTGSAMRHPKWSGGHRAVRLMRHPVQNSDDRDAFLLASGATVVGGCAGRLDTAATGPKQHSRLRYPAIPLRTNGIGSTPSRLRWAERVADEHLVPAASTNGAAGHPDVSVNGQSQTEATLRRIWTQCLGLDSIERNDNFFELGGDSLIAIGIATNASQRGLDVTPAGPLREPDAGERWRPPSTRQYAAGGLAKPAEASAHPTVPPNIAHFLEHGRAGGGTLARTADLAARPERERRGCPVGAHRGDQPP